MTDSFRDRELSVMEPISLATATERISVSERQARNLADAGDILLLARGVVDADSVSAYLRDRGVVAWRVWSERTAWGTIGSLAGAEGPLAPSLAGITSSQTNRELRRGRADLAGTKPIHHSPIRRASLSGQESRR
jgi:hypothetical protein